MQPAKFRENRKQIKSGELVRRDGELAFVQFSQLDESCLRIIAQIEQPLGVLLKHASGIGEQAITRRAIKQRLADLLFQLADRLAYSRLRPIQLFRRARKTPLPRYRQKDFQLR